MLPFIALVVTIGGLVAFGLAFLWSLTLVQAIDKRSQTDDETRRNLNLMAKGYTPLAPATQANNSGKTTGGIAHHTRVMREFHRSATAAIVLTVCGVFLTYHLANTTGVLYLVVSGGAHIADPWRQIAFLSVATALMNAFVGIACHHRGLSLFLLSLHGIVSRVLFGLALFFDRNSVSFWVFVIAGLVFGLVACVLVWLHRGKRIAGNSTVATLTYWAIPITLVVHFGVLLLSYETYAVLTFESTVVINVLADALLFLAPALYVISASYYKSSKVWPLFPHTIYADYGLGHYWKIEARPKLLQVKAAIKSQLGPNQSDAPKEVVMDKNDSDKEDYSSRDDS